MNICPPRPAATLTIGALMLAAGAAAQSPFTRALPESTIALVSFPDIKKSIQDMQNAPLARMWHEAQVQDFLADAIHMMKTRIDEGIERGVQMHENGMLPFNPKDLRSLELHSLNLALTSMELTMVGDEPMPRMGVIAHADFGASAPIWKNAIGTMLDMAVQRSNGQVSLTKSMKGDVEWMTILPPEGVDIPMSFNIAFFGNAMAFGTQPAELEAFIAGFGGNTSKLAAAPDYLRSAQRIEVDGAACEFFFRLDPMIDFMMNGLRLAKEHAPDFPEELSIEGLERAMLALGLRSVHGMGSTASYVGDRCRTETFLVNPAEERRGLTASIGADIDMSLLRWVPNNASSFSLASFDIGNVYDSIVGALNAYDEKFASEVLGEIAKMEADTGVSLQNDVFGALGNRLVSWSLPMQGMGTTATEMAYILEVKNETGLVNALEKLSQMSRGVVSLDKNERRGVTVYQLAVDASSLMGGGGLPMNPFASWVPTFSFKDGNLVLAFSSGDVRRAFKRMEREDDPTGDIRSNAEFASYVQRIPTDGVKSLSFTDWKATFEAYYQIGTMVGAFLPLDGDIPIDFTLLPDSATLTKHLCGSVAWSRVDDEGVSTTSLGPWGPETTALLLGATGAGAATAAYLVAPSAGRFR